MSDNAGRVVVAMSGGIDSSVAAALLIERGYQAIGVTLKLLDSSDTSPGKSSCSEEGIVQAQQAALVLGIPHHTLDCRQDFAKLVLQPSWSEYQNGRTPNPCIYCNQRIKFGSLGEHAARLGARWLATGHHARLDPGERGTAPQLLRGRDPGKDQSYFLFSLNQKQLSSALLPVGELTKKQVRERAHRLGLPNAERPESQDVCFGSNGEGFAEALRCMFRQPATSGSIVDTQGKTLGSHQGLHLFTVGQRRRLGVALGRRAWVKSIDPQAARVVLATEAGELLSDGLLASGVVWSLRFQDRDPASVLHCQVQVRYRHQPVEARVELMGQDRARVRFERPQRAVTPGQAAVFFHGDLVVGGGWIDRGFRSEEA